MSFQCFLRNVSEILKAPIEITINDFHDEPETEPEKQLCKNCTKNLVCLDCDAKDLGVVLCYSSCGDQFATPTKSEHEKSPEPEFKSPISPEVEDDTKSPEEIEVPEHAEELKTAVKQLEMSKVSEWSDDSFESEEHIQVSNNLESNQDENEISASPSETKNIEAEAENVIPERKLDEEESKSAKILTDKEINHEKEVIALLSDDLTASLTISEQIVEEPNTFVPKQKPNMIWSGNFQQKKENTPRFEKFPPHANEIRHPKPGYCDLDRPSPEEELNYNSIEWKGVSPKIHHLNRLNESLYKTNLFEDHHDEPKQIIKQKSGPSVNIKKLNDHLRNSDNYTEEFDVQQQIRSAEIKYHNSNAEKVHFVPQSAPVTSTYKTGGKKQFTPLKRNIPMPRPLRN